MIKHLLVIMFLLIYKVTFLLGQTGFGNTISYKIDSNVRDSVEKLTEQHNSSEIGKLYMKWFINDSISINTYTNPIKENFVQIMSYTSNDTIYVISSYGMFGEFGFYLELFKDSCRIFHFADKDSKVNNADLKCARLIPCMNKELTLSKRPTDKGNVTEGIIELVSQEYYRTHNGITSRNRLQIKAYFKIPVYKDYTNGEIKKHIEKQIQK